jgi:hypothetical protein
LENISSLRASEPQSISSDVPHLSVDSGSRRSLGRNKSIYEKSDQLKSKMGNNIVDISDNIIFHSILSNGGINMVISPEWGTRKLRLIIDL